MNILLDEEYDYKHTNDISNHVIVGWIEFLSDFFLVYHVNDMTFQISRYFCTKNIMYRPHHNQTNENDKQF